MALILGIGIGVFLLIILWCLAILLCVISSKLASPLSIIGPAVVSIVTLITAVLFALPQSKENVGSGRIELAEVRWSGVDWNAYVILPLHWLVSILIFAASGTLAVRHHLLQPGH